MPGRRLLRLAPLMLLLVPTPGPARGDESAAPHAAVQGRYELRYAATYSCTYPTGFVDQVVARGMIPLVYTGHDGPIEGKGTFRHQGTGYAFAGPLLLKGTVSGGVLRFPFPAGFSGGQRVYNRTDALAIRVEHGARVDVAVVSEHGVVCQGSCVFTLEGEPRLLSLTVVDGTATQKHVRPAKTWAAVKDEKGAVIVEARTRPDDAATWSKVQWGGDAGEPVPGQENRRRFRKATSRKVHVEARLGEGRDTLDVWILWAEVEIRDKGEAPKNAPKFGKAFDGTEKLGAHTYAGGDEGAGKIVAVARITPPGVHEVVPSGWIFRRTKQGARYANGAVDVPWTKWTPDDSHPKYLRLAPDAEDQVYDVDAPTIGGASKNDTNEAYINFRQWLEWDGTRCAEDALWHWQARWEFTADPKVRSMDVGKGHQPLPAGPHDPR